MRGEQIGWDHTGRRGKHTEVGLNAEVHRNPVYLWGNGLPRIETQNAGRAGLRQIQSLDGGDVLGADEVAEALDQVG